jgi:endonuclease/exonuclease/phosphatase family metal-dependent hydrolase
MLPGPQPMGKVVDYVKKAAPHADVIAFGMQELGKTTKFRQLLASSFQGYTNIGDTSLYGMTKIPKLCSTSMFVLAKNTWVQNGWIVGQDQIKARNFKLLKKPTKGGGVVLCQMKLGRGELVPVAFISCHLDASGVNERVAHVKQIMGATSINDLTTAKQFFLMGDLNYRLASTHMTYEEIAAKILSATGRAELAERDSFKLSDFPNFTFPPIHIGHGYQDTSWSYPTYKRSYKKSCKLSVTGDGKYEDCAPYEYNKNPCIVLDSLIKGMTLPANRLMVEMCIRCYFEKAIKKMEKKEKGSFDKTGLAKPSKKGDVQLVHKTQLGAKTLTRYENVKPFELGWLDRIGYRQFFTTVRNFKVSAIPEVFLSDHMPVLATCYLSQG